MKTFEVKKGITIVCEWKKTRQAFKHVATLLINGNERESVKINYLNRTWESYEFESVIKKLLDKTDELTEQEKKNFLNKASGKSKEEIASTFRTIGAIASLGEIFSNSKKEANDWKKRMLNAGLENKGLTMPEDWESLSETDKEQRLNKVIAELNK